MGIKKIVECVLFSIFAFSTYAQTSEFTVDERLYYGTMKSLCEHFKGRTYDSTERGLVFQKFVFFDNILSDTSTTRKQERIRWFDGLFYRLTYYIDSIGIENLEVKPTRNCKGYEEFFKHFKEGGDLNEFLPYTLTYFDRRNPDRPLGTLLFEPKTHKLLAWVVINLGGVRYYLTFNLI